MEKTFVILTAALLLLTSCSQKLASEQEEFKSLCMQNSGLGAWMKMVQMKDGVSVAKEACWGCMADMNNMICDKEDYLTFLKVNANQQKMSMGGMQ